MFKHSYIDKSGSKLQLTLHSRECSHWSLRYALFAWKKEFELKELDDKCVSSEDYKEERRDLRFKYIHYYKPR